MTTKERACADTPVLSPLDELEVQAIHLHELLILSELAIREGGDMERHAHAAVMAAVRFADELAQGVENVNRSERAGRTKQ